MLCMKTGVLLGLGLGLLLASPASAKVPPKLYGKAFFTNDRIKDQAADALAAYFAKKTPSIKLTRAKDKHWNTVLVAFFRKPTVDGPVTIWLYDKADKASIKAKEPVHVMSVNSTPRQVFIHDLDINPDLGFNKGRTYLVFVGQIIGKRDKHYARGEVSLE